jgi:HNH endonuclease
MYRLVNAFERHYRRTGNVAASMARTGTFGFNANWSKVSGFDAKVLTPDSVLTTRFIVLMHRFLNPDDALYYHSVWQMLNDEFASEIPENLRGDFARYDLRVRSGAGIKFRYNDQELSAEQIYRMVAEGDVFGRREEARIQLSEITRIPFASELFRFQFYDYSAAAFGIVSLFFNVMQKVKKSQVFQTRFGDPDPTSYQCIFCLGTTGPFTSEEHVIPEALGNPDWVLPKGYVCDTCNNGKLAKLDNALSSSPLFMYQRMLYLPYDKDGRLPEGRMGRLMWKRSSPTDLRMIAEPGTSPIKMEEELEDGWKRFSFSESIGQKFDERVLARALCKIALELVAADFGAQYACQERYNAVRSFILKGGNFRNKLLLRTKFTPEARIEMQYMQVAQGTVVALNLYGMHFLLNLEEQPLLQLSDALVRSDFIAFSLYGKSSWQQFSINMVPSAEMLANLPRKYWPSTYVETDAAPVEDSEDSNAAEISDQAQETDRMGEG